MHKKLKADYRFLQKESKAQLQACQADLQKESAEVSRLKQELDRSQTRNSELTSALTLERTSREKDVMQHKEALAPLESRGTTAEQELAALKAKCDTWLTDLVGITMELGRKFSLPLSPFLSNIPCLLASNFT